MTIREALTHVANNPTPSTDIMIDVRASELVARTLFDLANHPDQRVRGSATKANRAQNIIMNRMTGSRKVGTHSVTRRSAGVEFLDLTKGVI